MSVEQLSDGFKALTVELYGDESTSRRREHVKEIIRNQRRSKGNHA